MRCLSKGRDRLHLQACITPKVSRRQITVRSIQWHDKDACHVANRRSYIGALEERVAFLESKMPEYAQDHFHRQIPHNGQLRATGLEHADQNRAPESISSDDSLVNGVAYLSLCAAGTTDTPPEPFYLGSSSGATIARLLQSSVFTSAALTDAAFPFLRSEASPPSSPHTSDPSFRSPASRLPEGEETQYHFETFFDRLHTRWPVLDRKLYRQLYDSHVSDSGSLSITQRSILHLIYAISSKFLQLTRSRHTLDSQVSLSHLNLHVDN